MAFGVACLAAWLTVQAPWAEVPGSRYEVTTTERLEGTDLAEVVVTVSDDRERDNRLPVRVIVTASDGSHPDGSGQGVYADGRFFADGGFTVRVPAGRTEIRLSHGADYVPLTLEVDAKPGRRHRLQARLHRWFAPEARGWYGGDNHVHAQHDAKATVKASLAYTALQARANGLSYITEAGSHVSYEGIDRLSTDTFLLRHARELHAGCYSGHINTPGIGRPIPHEQSRRLSQQPRPVQALMRVVHELGGVVIHTHPLAPPHQLHWMGAMSLPSDAVLHECADLLDVDSRATELLWFAALNLGNRIACSSYTDAALGRRHTLSPGDRRVYCHAEAFTYPAIVDALRRGRTFATNGGPLFGFFTVDGHEPGDTLRAAGGEAHEARAEVHALYPLESVQLYRNGNVLKAFDVGGRTGRVVLTHALAETKRSWLLLRAEDERGHWAITSPVYFEPAKPAPPPRSEAILLEISNCTRMVQLRREFFAHLIVTVSPGEILASAELLRDGRPCKGFTPEMGDRRDAGKTPVTEPFGEYAPGWLWYPESARSVHFQADWPVAESGWYSVRAKTRQGRTFSSDRVRFDAENPNSRELSVAHLRGGDSRLALWGYGEDMPLADVKPPYDGDHWWYPKRRFWRLTATFADQTHTVGDGANTEGERRFARNQVGGVP